MHTGKRLNGGQEVAEENLRSVGSKGAWRQCKKKGQKCLWSGQSTKERRRTILVSSAFILLEKRDMERFA